MNFIKQFIFGKNLKLTLLATVALAMVLSLIPRAIHTQTLAENCSNAPSVATMNYWPVTFSNPAEVCRDYPALDAKVVGGQFSQSQADLDNGITMTVGQQGTALIYIHNGAAVNGDPNLTTARNVKVTTSVTNFVGPNQTISVSFGGTNTNTVYRTFNVQIPSGSRLVVIPNSGQLYNYLGNTLQTGLNIGNSTYTIGDQLSCFEHSLFLSFGFQVVQDQVTTNPTLSIQKQVRNLSTGSGSFVDSVNANQNDRVEYQVVARNTGNSTATAVNLNDSGTFGTSFESGSLRVDGQSRSGSIPGTVSLGDIAANGQVTVTYTMRTTTSSGTLINTATANGSNTNFVSDTATVNVNFNQTGQVQLTIQKQVRNLTQGGSLQDFITVNQNDRVEYSIRVRNTGAVIATNVTVNDSGTFGTSFESGSLRVNGSSRSGSIPGTVSLGDMSSNQEITITYNSNVNVSSGTLVNTAIAQASNATSVTDTASVQVNFQNNFTDRRLSINKLVRNETQGGSLQDFINARNGDRVNFEITVQNTGNQTVNSVRLSDNYPFGLINPTNFLLDGQFVSVNTFSNSFDLSLGSMSPGQTRRFTFSMTVNTTSGSLTNIGTVRGDGVNDLQDNATVQVNSVFVPPVVNPPFGSANITQSKRVNNDTKNQDGTQVNASREDFLTFTLVTTNTGSADSFNYVIQDDVSQVIPFADITDLGGAQLNGNTLSYPAQTIRAGETITKTFRVRVKAFLANTVPYQIRNTYGNTVVVNIPAATLLVAPQTGVAENTASAVAFAAVLTLAFVAVRRRAEIMNWIKA